MIDFKDLVRSDSYHSAAESTFSFLEDVLLPDADRDELTRRINKQVCIAEIGAYQKGYDLGREIWEETEDEGA